MRRDRGQVGDDVGERSAGIQLMRAALPEERLDPGKVIQDHRSFQWSLPVVVRRSACDPVKDHVSRGAEQDDRVETVVELRLVAHAPFKEEGATIIGLQQRGDPFLDPEPLSAGTGQARPEGRRMLLSPTSRLGGVPPVEFHDPSDDWGSSRLDDRLRKCRARQRKVTPGRLRAGHGVIASAVARSIDARLVTLNVRQYPMFGG